MKSYRWLVVLLGPIFLFVWLRPQRSARTLAWESGLDGPVLAPAAGLGDYAASAFLGEGWDGLGKGPFRQTRSGLKRGSDLRFYLDRGLDVTVRLEGCWVAPRPGSREAPESAEIWMDGRQRWKLAPQDRWSGYQWEIPAAWLRPGENRLELRARRPTRWRTFQVWPTAAGREAGGLAHNGPDRLAFARSRSFALELDSPARLAVGPFQPWLTPGAAGLTQAPALRVDLDGPGVQRSWTLQAPGNLALPASGGPARLTVTALGPERPAPGQAGVKLGPLRLETAVEKAPAVPPPVAAPPVARPANVIVYLIDTLRADHLGCYGYTRGHTPNLDAFAKDAVVFERCTAQSGWTKPATASVLTSVAPRDHGAMDFGDKLSSQVPYLPEVLRQSRYHTRAVVTNPFVTKIFGFERGFEAFEFLPLASSARVNGSVLPWLSQRPPQPFFLYLHTLDPHMPYGQKFTEEQALALQTLAHQQSFWGRSDPRVEGALNKAVSAYDADVSANDASFGQLVAELKRRGLYEDSLIVVLSDHGEEFLDHGRVGHNNSLYQELLHVPLILKFPGGRGAGTRVAELWQQIDVAPTILRAVGVQAPAGMTGHAYFPEGEPAEATRPALISLRSGVGAERWGQGSQPRLLDMDALRSGDWIYTSTHESVDSRLAPRQLYDLAADPGEGTNQAWNRQELTVAMATALQRLLPASPRSGALAPAPQVDEVLRSLQYLR